MQSLDCVRQGVLQFMVEKREGPVLRTENEHVFDF